MINKFLLLLIQASHWAFLILAGISVPLVLICEPFYVSFPICAWIMHLTFSRTLDCPWTRLENVYRSKCGKPEIGGFISYYIIKPLRKNKKSYREVYSADTNKIDEDGGPYLVEIKSDK
mgnify:FL=1